MLPKPRCVLADCYARLGLIRQAREQYLRILSDPSCPKVLLSDVAAGLGSIGDARMALQVCRELARRMPSSHVTRFSMAYHMHRQGHPAEAIVCVLAQAHELAPDSPLYRVVLASFLDQVGRRDEAHDLLRDVSAEAFRCPSVARRAVVQFRHSVSLNDWNASHEYAGSLHETSHAATCGAWLGLTGRRYQGRRPLLLTADRN
jgi:hypothetical protein